MKHSLHIYLGIVIAILLVLVQPVASSSAQSLINLTDNKVNYDFGTHLEITARLSSNQSPDLVYIVLQPQGQASRQVKLIPGADGLLTFKYDLSHDPLKPFSRIYYWYQFEMSDGSVQTSPSFWFDYIDDRYQWKLLSSKLFEIHWTGKDTSIGQKLTDIATIGLENATTILPVVPQLPISIYVYPDVNALQDTLTLSHQSWVAGHTSPDLGVVLVSDGTDETNLIELERQIPHEIMHILQYQVTGENYSKAPAWLLEGLATLAQSYPNPDDDRILTTAVQSNALISLDDMCGSLPIDSTRALIGYAQSKSVVEYLQQHYGSKVFLQMLQSSTNGLSCEQVLEKNTNLTSVQLLSNWQSETFPGSLHKTSNNLLLYILGGCGLLILIVIGVREILRRRVQEQ